jgi:hypothetical protein
VAASALNIAAFSVYVETEVRQQKAAALPATGGFASQLHKFLLLVR